MCSNGQRRSDAEQVAMKPEQKNTKQHGQACSKEEEEQR